MLDNKLLTLLACPQCHGELVFDKESQPNTDTIGELICLVDASKALACAGYRCGQY